MSVTNLQFRDATEADLPAIVALLVDDIRGRGRDDASLPLDPVYGDAFAAIDADPNQRLIVALKDGETVGTLQLSFLPGLGHRGAWRGQIEAVRVASRLRGGGFGSQMIAWAIEACRERGCKLVQLTSDAGRLDAHRFYTRLGFAQSHLGFKRVL
ncbi:GNAT family N-acetyltransferase [Jiella sp. MQZ9-1]|uniref:GNAT family N-acetyltransferase n=1 Tax=Jiella flava TaxID=2816857 RepID=A0A939FX65_9HYPH|nr:GNAT family N-acetyltransferase [Jiella flava]MBO0661142.1 GNAT family N-acetyltransferase [Jiella flava]MCD2469788.1 GNAT family N-acetyltransferase [Jiella flava]